MHDAQDCPKCGEGCYRDEVHVGVGWVYGPWGCPGCGWSDDPRYDRSAGPSPAQRESPDRYVDQFGGSTPVAAIADHAARFGVPRGLVEEAFRVDPGPAEAARPGTGTGPKVRPVRTGSTSFRLDGLTHTRPPYPGGPVCGGQVCAERFEWEADEANEARPPTWESYCQTCLDCDPSGWGSLRECVQAAVQTWADAQAGM